MAHVNADTLKMIALTISDFFAASHWRWLHSRFQISSQRHIEVRCVNFVHMSTLQSILPLA